MFSFLGETTCQKGIMLPAPCFPPWAEPGFSASSLQCLVDKCYTDEHKPLVGTCPVAGITDVLLVQ